jgi:hypothetical protein
MRVDYLTFATVWQPTSVLSVKCSQNPASIYKCMDTRKIISNSRCHVCSVAKCQSTLAVNIRSEFER